MGIVKNGLAVATATLVFGAGAALAGDMPKLVIDGQTMITEAVAPSYTPHLKHVFSGWVFRRKETQALETDDFDNPGFVFIDQAKEAFNTADGSEGKSCASCHSLSDFKGLRTHLPRVNADGKLETMEDLINRSRVKHMGAKAWKYGGGKMAAMVALISLQSRGMPMDVAVDGAAKPYWEKGQKLYYTRVGQLDMACANCHEDNYGKMIRADHLSQGQINGFPAYRLKNAKLNSVHKRFKGCMKNIRAKPYKVGSDEFKALELYVASRGNGLSSESPSVRN